MLSHLIICIVSAVLLLLLAAGLWIELDPDEPGTTRKGVVAVVSAVMFVLVVALIIELPKIFQPR